MLEIGVRAYDAYQGFDFVSSLRAEFYLPKKIRPFRTFGFNLYRDGEISSRHGEQFSLEKPQGVFRIVVFGGSTTENSNAYKESQTHYPLVLQQILNQTTKREVEVINVAYQAYAIPHSIILLSLDVISWNPDLLIISHNVNDLMASYWPNFTFDYSNKFGHEFYTLPDFEKPYMLFDLIFRHSQLYWVVKERFKRAFGLTRKALVRKSYGPLPPAVARDVFKRNLGNYTNMLTI